MYRVASVAAVTDSTPLLTRSIYSSGERPSSRACRRILLRCRLASRSDAASASRAERPSDVVWSEEEGGPPDEY